MGVAFVGTCFPPSFDGRWLSALFTRRPMHWLPQTKPDPSWMRLRSLVLGAGILRPPRQRSYQWPAPSPQCGPLNPLPSLKCCGKPGLPIGEWDSWSFPAAYQSCGSQCTAWDWWAAPTQVCCMSLRQVTDEELGYLPPSKELVGGQKNWWEDENWWED